MFFRGLGELLIFGLSFVCDASRSIRDTYDEREKIISSYRLISKSQCLLEMRSSDGFVHASPITDLDRSEESKSLRANRFALASVNGLERVEAKWHLSTERSIELDLVANIFFFFFFSLINDERFSWRYFSVSSRGCQSLSHPTQRQSTLSLRWSSSAVLRLRKYWRPTSMILSDVLRSKGINGIVYSKHNGRMSISDSGIRFVCSTKIPRRVIWRSRRRVNRA